MEAKNTEIVNNKAAMGELVDPMQRYKEVKQNKNMFDDDDIVEISTPGVLESSR